MRNVAVYNLGTGQVERWLRDHDDIVEPGWFPGKGVLYVPPDTPVLPLIHYVVDGQLVETPPA